MMTPIILPYKGMFPKIAPSVYIAPGAAVIGDVEIGEESSIWFNCTIRGDVHEIRIGARTNIQDGTVVHVTADRFGCYIGSDVLIGHGAIIHACTLEDKSFVGMGATVLDGAVVESGAMVAAGALVPPGKRVLAGEVWAGNPAKKMRDYTPKDAAALEHGVQHYRGVGAEFLRQAKEGK